MNHVVLQRVQPYLDTVSFTRLMQTRKSDYYHDEYWLDFVQRRVPQLTCLDSPRKAVAFHYIITWSMRLKETPLTVAWFQALVDWLQYKCTIHLIHNTIFRYDGGVFDKLVFDHLKPAQWMLWERLRHKYHRRRNDLYNLEKRYGYADWSPPAKRPLLCF